MICTVLAVAPLAARADDWTPAFSDDYIETTDASVVKTVNGAAVTYCFTNTSAEFNYRIKTSNPLKELLVCGGGGGGGNMLAGGGGAGGLIVRTPRAALSAGAEGTISVGAGGTAGASYYTVATSGTQTRLVLTNEEFIAYGGGKGGNQYVRDPDTTGPCGSAGGQAWNNSGEVVGAYTEGQGTRGGHGVSGKLGGGGGGGYSQRGANGSDASYGYGGDGYVFLATGVRQVYASGGGGAGAAGGDFSGGAGGTSAHPDGANGRDGFGGGGGGGLTTTKGGRGGSGAVVFSFAPATPSSWFAASLAMTRYPQNGRAICPVPTVTDELSGEMLVQGEDYTLTYQNNVAVGVGTVLVSGLGDYAGCGTILTFDICESYRDDFVATDDFSVRAITNDTSIVYCFTNVYLNEKGEIDRSGYGLFLNTDLPLVDALVVAGGGAGGAMLGGGGGGGGVLYHLYAQTFSPDAYLRVVCGEGGQRVKGYYGRGGSGGNSEFETGVSDILAYGGSGGGGNYSSNIPDCTVPHGSAGGSANNGQTYGTWTDGQGNHGGLSGGYNSAGGGGGAGEAGQNGSGSVGGDGGEGLQFFISGTPVVYGAGGGGGAATTGGAGGTNAGDGSASGNAAGGLAGTGAGGGGGASADSAYSGAGGSGIVLLRFPRTTTSIVADPQDDEILYDGESHVPSVDVKWPTTGVTVTWSTDGAEGPFHEGTPPAQTSAGTYKVWYRLAASGYDARIVASAVTIVEPTYAQQTKWFVKPDGDPEASGATWEKATTLSNAFVLVTAGSAATTVSSAQYHEIVLKAGTPEDPVVFDLSDEPAAYDSGLTLFKTAVGYVRVRSEASDRDPKRVVLKGGYDASPKRCINVAGAMKVEGLTFRDFYVANSGGAICNTAKKSLWVNMCCFEHNFATTSGGAVDFGSKASVATNCVFHFNRCTTTRGGAAVKYGTIYDSTMTSNSGTWAACYSKVLSSQLVENQGGVFYCSQAYDCTILSNRTADATAYTYLATVTCRNSGADGGTDACVLSHCHVEGNVSPEISASWSSGNRGLTQDTCSICTFVANDLSYGGKFGHEGTLTNCVFTGYWTGSVVYSATSRNCLFTNNTTTVLNGGTHKNDVVMFNKGGCLLSGPQGVTTVYEQCLVVSNTVTQSIVNPYICTALSLVACTIADNDCGTGTDNAAIYPGLWRGYPVKAVKGCLISGNKPYDIDFSTKGTDVVTNTLFSTFYGTPAVTNGSICVSASRVKFAAPDELHPYGYGLRRLSPAVDRGYDNGYTAESRDLTGVLPRVHNFGAGGKPDCGCYECEEKSPGLAVIIK